MKNMESHPRRAYTTTEKIFIAVLSLLCIASFTWFVINARAYYAAGDLEPVHHQRYADAQPRQHIPPNSIQSWMTFDYINVVFGLNPSYLQSKLAIMDKHYPNIRIDTYARRNKLNQQSLLQNIQQLVNQHNN
jgi:hypothetical protein